MVIEMLTLENIKDGLVSKLKQENISQENIVRIIADFIIAAGDTVRNKNNSIGIYLGTLK